MSDRASRFVVRSDGSNCEVLSYADWKADRQESGGGHDGDAALTMFELCQILAISAFASVFAVACAVGAHVLLSDTGKAIRSM